MASRGLTARGDGRGFRNERVRRVDESPEVAGNFGKCECSLLVQAPTLRQEIDALLMPWRGGPQRPDTGKPRQSGASVKVSDGTRTRDRLDHNQELYQLSYAHQGSGSG